MYSPAKYERLSHQAQALKGLNCFGELVLLRTDFNVPLSKGPKGELSVSDATRIDAALPTVRLLLGKGAKLVIVSHLGRPEPNKASLSALRLTHGLNPVFSVLKERLGAENIGFVDSCVGPVADTAIAQLQSGQALLLENVRFHVGETQNDLDFAKQLSKHFRIFVNDAFGVLHRDDASVTGVAKIIPNCFPGLLVAKEVHILSGLFLRPRMPLVVLIGGAKVADKMGVVGKFCETASKVLVGGKMAFTFLAAKGVLVGATQVDEPHRFEEARNIEKKARSYGVDFLLPSDQVVAANLEGPLPTAIVPLTLACCTSPLEPCIRDGFVGGDIGPKTVKEFEDVIQTACTIFWNGPLGAYEMPAFSFGTLAIAHAIAAATKKGATTIVGGGDSSAAVHEAGLTAADFTHICTGGGASLEFLQGNMLPGLAVWT
ncbi:hypothetical protein WJX74_009384 [Apatococcus lobatus]|uniref:Phosphoglycerate kinase n=1 Tax=Apatococcus lobatus TaxID=904363 RepID=A0AAW1RNA3_9CHLO